MNSRRGALSQLGSRTAAPPISWLLGLQLERPELVSLAAGFTDQETLPLAETRELCERLMASPARGRPALQYGATPGLDTLRRLAAGQVAELDARATGQSPSPSVYAPGRVLITNGSQQLLYLAVEALCDPGDIVLVEDPTYFVFLGIAQSHSLVCRGVRLTPAGLDLDHLDLVLADLRRSGLLPRLKLFYTVSYLQNPTGNSLTVAHKRAVAERLRACEPVAGHPIYLLEDAAYRELRFAGADEPSFLTLPRMADRVIYTATFTKPFATGIRVGYGLLPNPLFEVMTRIKGNHDFGTSSLVQHLLAEALQRGVYSRHLKVLRRRYAAKAETLVAAMAEHFPPGVEWNEPQGGLYGWVRLPGRHPAGPRSPFFLQALGRGVLYVPGELCYAPDPSRPLPRHELRLSFGSASEEDIRRGVELLGQVMRSRLPQRRAPRRDRTTQR